MNDFSGLLTIVTGRLAEEAVDDALAIGKRAFSAEMAGCPPDGVPQQRLFGKLLSAAANQLQSMEASA